MNRLIDQYGRCVVMAGLVGVMVGVCVFLGGCGLFGSQRTTPMTDELVAEIIEDHNLRVGQVERLWARVSVRIRGVDAQGDRFEEQGEGHLQVVWPDRVSLTIGKLGETYFAYGANSDQYWIFDLMDSDHRVAMVGAIDRVSPYRLASELGLRHPGDLIGMLGMEPIEASEVLETRWDEGTGLVVVRFESRWGLIEYWFDPSRRLVMEVMSIGIGGDGDGDILGRASLSRYKELLNDHRLGSGVLVPGKVEVVQAGEAGGGAGKDGGFVRIELSEPSQRSIRAMVYDFKRLSRAYRVHETVDMDRDD